MSHRDLIWAREEKAPTGRTWSRPLILAALSNKRLPG